MTPERWKKLEEVFESAVQRPPGERAQFLDLACAGDEALRSQVETLLLSYEQAGSFMESPALGSALSETLVDQTTSVIGLRLGSYKIVRELGRGGMGSVYLAVRADDEFHKQVAIKLIKRGMDTDFIIRRFRNERQILASLDDPNIARLVDGGTTEDGLPYFVMEYVEGLPIYQYCDQHRLTVVERLRLFRKVCSAVHYAHQRRVIHRDLKPSNILVTVEGVPKLLDFGIAKLLNPEMASQTLDPTTAAIRLMTPEYASPEQIRGDIVTAASDVYSLGVMLYELLTDHRPYRLKDHSPQELARVICEEDPDPPSVAINLIEVITSDDSEPLEVTPETVSHARSTTPEQLRRELSGSLDNIVLKALRKETAKRYGSVDELSEDLRRFQEGHPVSAPSYFPTPATLLVDTPLSSSTLHSVAVLPFHVLRVEEKADEFLGMGMADAIITKLSNIQRIMVRPTSSIIKYYNGTHNVLAAGHELNVGYVLDGRIQRAGDRVRVTVQLVRVRDGIPLWAAKFDENFTDIFGVEDSISEQVARALVPRLTGQERELLLKRETANADAYKAFMKGRYFWNKFTAEDFGKAFEQFREAIRLDAEFAQAYVGIADYYNWAAIYGIGPPHEYFPLAKAAAARALELDESLAEAHAALAFSTLCYDWDWDSAEARFKRSLELNPNYAPAHQWYSNALATQGRFEEAIAEIKRAQEINPLSMMDRSIAGWTYYHARQYDLAVDELHKALEIDANFGNGYLMLGAVYERLGRYEDSIETVQRALELMDGSIMPLWALGFTLAVSGRRTEAREVIEKLDILSQKRYVSPYYYALIYTGLGDREKAFEWLEKACESRDEWLIWLGTEPKLDELRSDPRFPQLLRRIGLKGDETRKAISYADEHSGNGSRTISTSGNLSPDRRAGQTGEVSSGPTTRSEEIRGRKRLLMLGAGLTALIIIIAATLGLYNLLSRPATHFIRTNLKKLTTSGNVITAAISPDGKHVAYVMDEAGMHGIWVRQISIANSIRIIPAGDTEIRGLTFSNDGTYLHYVTSGADGRGVLYQVPALGGSVREVKRGVDSPISFAPDGKQFAFIRSNAAKGEEELLVGDLSTGEEQQVGLRKFPEHFSLDAAPAWSPDGKRIACVTQSTDTHGFFMKVSELKLADRKETPLSEKRWLEIGQTAWISDGSGLMITAQDESSAFQHVWLVSYPSGDARRITSDLSDYRGVSLPTSSDLLLTVQRQTLTIIWITPREDAENPKQVTSGAGRFFDLTWTPDGRILYSSDASGIADIWEMDVDGTGQRQLTADAGRNYAPVAAPDGRYIFFHSNRSGTWQIWRMDRDGSNQIQMTSEKEESNWPQVSPDGKWVFYQHVTSGTARIWKLPVEGGTAVRLTTALSMRPSVSPDGLFIAHWQKADAPNAPWQIAITPFEGGEPAQLLDIPQSPANSNSVINWSRDGKGVLFIDFRDNVANLMIKPLDDAPARQLSNFTKEQFYSFDIAPDGRMVLSRGFRTNDAVIISEAK